MSRQPEPSWNDLSIFQQYETARWLALFPALTVMCFLRRNIGYRILNPVWITVTAAAMFLFGELARLTPNHDVLQVMAGLFLLAGLAQRRQRWKERRQGVHVHSFYVGDSSLEFRWLPEFLLRENRVARFVEPLVIIAAGALVVNFSPATGFWLFFAGVSLRAFEGAVREKEQEREMDLMDGIIESGIQGERVERLTSPPAQQHAETTHAIPTGLGADIESQIKARQARHVARAKPGAARPQEVRPDAISAQASTQQASREDKPTGRSDAVAARLRPLTRSDRFWRFLWGRRLWEWWKRRTSKRI